MATSSSGVNNPVASMKPGDILADASVAQYVKALGIAVADAQSALDINSIEQVAEYARPYPGLGNKSLFQLGLTPPFYHFQTADVSVALQLNMKVAESEELGVGVKINFSHEQGADENANMREAQITVKASPASVTVNGTKKTSSKERLQDAAEELATALRTPAGPFERAVLSTDGASVTVALDPAASKNPVATSNTVLFTSGKTSGLIRIQNNPTAAETWTLATGKSVEVAPKTNKLTYARAVRDGIKAIDGFDAGIVAEPTGDTVAPDGTIGMALFATAEPADDKPNFLTLDAAARSELLNVAKIITDAGLDVDIVGFADRRGAEAYNDGLGQRRANLVKAFLIGNGTLNVPASRIHDVKSEGETHWRNRPDNEDNRQFRRAEVRVRGSNDLFIRVEQTGGTKLKASPTPDGTGSNNGFLWNNSATVEGINGDAKVQFTRTGGSAQTQALSGGKVTTPVYAKDTPQAYAWNLKEAINQNQATHKVKANFIDLPNGAAAVELVDGDGAVVISAYTLSTSNIPLAASEGASVTKPLSQVTPGATVEPRAKTKTAIMAGVSVDYRTARSFEQSVTGNSSISAHMVSVPPPDLFYELIKQQFVNGGG